MEPICAAPLRHGERKGLPATGHRSGYYRHRQAGEPPCGDCRDFYFRHEARSKIQRVCETCGEDYESTPHALYRYCSAECRPSRNTLPKSVRQRIVERDEGICQLCGGLTDPDDIEMVNEGQTPVVGVDYPTLDHIVPRSAGGTDEITNLRLAHHRCNSTRGVANGEQLAWAV